MRLLSVSALMLSLLQVSVFGSAQLRPAQFKSIYPDTLGALVANSDLIVFTRCESYDPPPTRSSGAAQTLEAAAIIKVLKGHYASASITVEDGKGPFTFSQTPGTRYILFLKLSQGAYRFTYRQHGAAALPAESGRDVQTTVENMISAAIAARGTSDYDRFWAVDMVVGDPSANPALTAGLRGALTWTLPQAQAQIIAALIMRHGPSALTLAGAFLDHRDWADRAGPILAALGLAGGSVEVAMLAKAAGSSEPEPAREYALTALGASRSPEAIRAIEPALNDPDWTIRAKAAGALGSTHLKSAIAPLSRALTDGDERVRYAAVRGMAAIEGMSSDWIPLDDAQFRSKEEAYLAYWRHWADANAPPALH